MQARFVGGTRMPAASVDAVLAAFLGSIICGVSGVASAVNGYNSRAQQNTSAHSKWQVEHHGCVVGWAN
jgi:hypothetical protein